VLLRVTNKHAGRRRRRRRYAQATTRIKTTQHSIHDTISLAISEIFSVTEWLDFEIWVTLVSFKVIENGAVRQTMYDFLLLVRHCNYSFILYSLRVI